MASINARLIRARQARVRTGLELLLDIGPLPDPERRCREEAAEGSLPARGGRPIALLLAGTELVDRAADQLADRLARLRLVALVVEEDLGAVSQGHMHMLACACCRMGARCRNWGTTGSVTPMETSMDSVGRIVVPKPLRDALGLTVGSTVDISRYGAGLQLVPTGRTAALVDESGVLVATGETAINDEVVFGLIDSGRR